MNVLLFGPTGMIGDGVLHECLADARVDSVLAVTRSSLVLVHPKLRVHQRTDFVDFADLAPDLAGIDACFFCLGVSAVGMTEARYREVTFDLTLAAGTALAGANPGAVFCYVSGEGTRAGLPDPAAAGSEARHDNRKPRPGDDRGCRGGAQQARAGEPGHQRAGGRSLTALRPEHAI